MSMSLNKESRIIWASTRENLSSGVSKKRDSNQSTQLQRLARKLKFRSKQVNILYAQAGLRLCCSQTSEDRFSRVEAHMD